MHGSKATDRRQKRYGVGVQRRTCSNVGVQEPLRRVRVCMNHSIGGGTVQSAWSSFILHRARQRNVLGERR
jgi:hypothetical protein